MSPWRSEDSYEKAVPMAMSAITDAHAEASVVQVQDGVRCRAVALVGSQAVAVAVTDLVQVVDVGVVVGGVQGCGRRVCLQQPVSGCGGDGVAQAVRQGVGHAVRDAVRHGEGRVVLHVVVRPEPGFELLVDVVAQGVPLHSVSPQHPFTVFAFGVSFEIHGRDLVHLAGDQSQKRCRRYLRTEGGLEDCV